ncbi:MAG: class I SAM-dependent methyltransferase [Nitrospinae bacterium]|nr:class I SAM-dependent methyltransferase [Nitrospinota bacterium]
MGAEEGTNRKFDPKEKDRLRDPRRIEREDPNLIWEKLEPDNPLCVVDVGCGLGFAAIPFSKKMPGGKVYACDVSSEMLEAMKLEAKAADARNIIPVLSQEAKIPVETGIADLLLTQNLHHELHSAVETLLECKRILRRGGKIAVIDWKKEPMEFGPPQEIRVTAKKIGSDLREAGFVRIESLDALRFHTFIVARKP